MSARTSSFLPDRNDFVGAKGQLVKHRPRSTQKFGQHAFLVMDRNGERESKPILHSSANPSRNLTRDAAQRQCDLNRFSRKAGL